MKRIIDYVFIFIIVISTNAYSKGVVAGTDISNTATLEYTIGGTLHTTDSNTVVDRVDQLIDVNVVWQDTAPIMVASAENDKVLTYKITNTGNGKDKFTLTHIHDTTSDFAITTPQIYRDSNNNGFFDGADLLINDIELEADESSVIFLVADIPSGVYADGSQSKNIIEAISLTGGSGTTGTIHAGAGVDGVDAVDGFNGGRSRATGIYEINQISVKLTKSATASSSEVYTGTHITYSIVVSLDGVGNVDTLKISDAIPAGCSYIAGSLKLDGTALSDSVDGDMGSFDSNEIRVDLGNVSQTTTTAYLKTITFEVKIE